LTFCRYIPITTMTAASVGSRIARSILSSQALAARTANSHYVCGFGITTGRRQEMSSKAKLQNVLGKMGSAIKEKSIGKDKGSKKEEKVTGHKAKAALCGDYEHHGPPDLSFREFEDIRKAGTATLIDVRDPEELVTKGTIPGGVNVPTKVFAEAFSTMDPADFESRFGAPRPEAEDEVVIYCQTGKRSMEAARYLATFYGYTQAKSYSGLIDWTAHKQQK